jgi:hypothetical protein
MPCTGNVKNLSFKAVNPALAGILRNLSYIRILFNRLQMIPASIKCLDFAI